MARLLTAALAALAATAIGAAPAAAKDKNKDAGSSNPLVASSSGGSAPATGSDWGGAVDLVNSECQLTDGCLFSGNDKSAGAIAEAYTEVFPLSQISLSVVQKVEFQGSQYSGAWTSDVGVSFVTVKAGNQFILYYLGAPATAGEWSTAGLLNNQDIAHAVSHISLWSGSYASGVTPPLPPTQDPPIVRLLSEAPLGAFNTAIPEPTTWLTMILGLVALGAMLRRRGARLIR